MALSIEERREIERRLARLEAQAHHHPDDVPQQPADDRDWLRRLARLQAEADVHRASGSSR